MIASEDVSHTYSSVWMGDYPSNPLRTGELDSEHGWVPQFNNQNQNPENMTAKKSEMTI